MPFGDSSTSSSSTRTEQLKGTRKLEKGADPPPTKQQGKRFHVSHGDGFDSLEVLGSNPKLKLVSGMTYDVMYCRL
jgi:hypothetical protein